MKDRIKLIMENVGLSQQEFASKLGISAASLSSIFTGRTNPTSNHVMAIHKVFPQINVNWLMFGEGEICMGNNSFLNNSANMKTEANSTVDEEKTEEDVPALNNGPQKPLSLFEDDHTLPSSALPSSPAPSPTRKESRATIRGNGQIVTTNIVAEREDKKIKEIRVFYSNGTYESFVPSK